MIDRKKVIKGLEHCITVETLDTCKRCPYDEQCRTDPSALERDALELLKEQEPVKVRHLHGTKVTMHEKIVFTDECGYCSGYLLKPWKACPICGKAVKWDD